MLTPDYTLCVVTRAVPRLGRGHVDVATAALVGGARFLQFRDKELSTRELLTIARELRRLTRAHQAILVINDRVDIALAAEADGVHLGQDDMPTAEARRLLGPTAIIGVSAATVDTARAAEAAGADYLGAGPVYPTGSKADAGEAIGLTRIAELRAAVGIPILGIGGIVAANAAAVIEAGATGLAVISAVTDAANMAQATQELRTKVEGARTHGGPRPRPHHQEN
jgi:thiamine-phosphate pyrophosphorylase